jgi:hypothetical protein
VCVCVYVCFLTSVTAAPSVDDVMSVNNNKKRQEKQITVIMITTKVFIISAFCRHVTRRAEE